MIPYKSRSGKESGVIAYEINDESIAVTFGDIINVYSYSSAGATAIEKMKILAKANRGLSTFIARNSPAYANKITH